MKGIIIVTWDFTKLSEYALDAALKISMKTEDDIKLLHVLAKESELTEKKQLLKSVAEEISEKQTKKIDYIVEKGSIFNTITEVVERENANLVVMGTHGIRGMQKLTGSWALKVIEGSKVPFLVVQDKVSDNKALRIVVPMDFKSENKEKLKWAHYFAKHYKSKIFIYSKFYKDKGLKQKLNSNIRVAKQFFAQEGINYELVEAPPKGGFEENIILYSSSISADIIVVTTTRTITKASYVLGLPEQYLIANNAKIPVLVINPSIKMSSKFTPY